MDGNLELYVLRLISMHNDLFFNAELSEEMFAYEGHKRIFKFLEKNIKAKLPTNIHTMKAFFSELEKEDFVDAGFEEVFYHSSFSLLNFQQAHQSLHNLSDKRKIKGIMLEQEENLLKPSKNAQEIKESIVERLEDIRDLFSENRTVDLRQSIIDAFTKERAQMIMTGYPELDKITSGFEEGSFIVLAARPAMGKSAFCINIAINIARKQSPVLIFSLEMNHEQISRRIVAKLGSLNLTKLKNREIDVKSQYEYEAFQKAKEEASQLNIKINDEGSTTLAKLRYEIRKFIKKTGGKVVIIDYVQLIKHNVKGGSVERITEITNTLKAIAMDFKIVVIGLSQLSRAVETRDDKRPMLSDLRESGSIEQDANLVMFVLRPEYYMEQQRPDENDPQKYKEWCAEMQRLKGLAYIIVAKNRDGKTGEARLKFDGEFSSFLSINN